MVCSQTLPAAARCEQSSYGVNRVRTRAAGNSATRDPSRVHAESAGAIPDRLPQRVGFLYRSRLGGSGGVPVSGVCTSGPRQSAPLLCVL